MFSRASKEDLVSGFQFRWFLLFLAIVEVLTEIRWNKDYILLQLYSDTILKKKKKPNLSSFPYFVQTCTSTNNLNHTRFGCNEAKHMLSTTETCFHHRINPFLISHFWQLTFFCKFHSFMIVISLTFVFFLYLNQH